jgi:hypothetical protein
MDNSVTTIEDSAFAYCSNLTSIFLPNSIEKIGMAAFQYCSKLTSVNIPQDVSFLGGWAFYKCVSLETVYYNATDCINTASFTGSTFYPIFISCPLFTNLIIGNNVQRIPNFVFCDCRGLKSFTIPNSVTSIGMYAFYFCTGLTSVTIPNSVTSIGSSAFNSCSSLTSVSIGNSVTSIGNSAFASCSGLTSVTNLSLIPQTISSNVFSGVTLSTCTLKVAASSLTTYQNAAVWEDFAPIISGGVLFSVKANNSAWGNVTTNIPEGLYPVGTSVTFTATPNTGYRFFKWNDDIADNPRIITVTSDTAFTAIFEKTYNLTASANNPVYGTVSGSGIYPEDSSATVTAMPNTGYRFFTWNDGNTDNPRTVTVTSDTVFTAIFEIMYTVQVSANNPVYGTVSGSGIYP